MKFLILSAFLPLFSVSVHQEAPDLFRYQGFIFPHNKVSAVRRQRNSDEQEEMMLGDTPLDEVIEYTPSLQEMKNRFYSVCCANDVMGVINLYESWRNSPRRPLLCSFLFPDKVLDQSSHGSLTEENGATQLSVLLAAMEGNLEAQVLSLSFLRKICHNFDKKQLDIYEQRLIQRLKQQRGPLGNSVLILKIVSESDSDIKLQNLQGLALPTKEQIGEAFLFSTRSLVWLAEYNLGVGSVKEAQNCLEQAAERGSKYAIMQRYRLASQNGTSELAKQILSSHSSRLGGYEFLLSAYEYQFGLYGQERDLSEANRLYKMAVGERCREAAYEYGDFLIHVADTLPGNDPRYGEFYKHAIDLYEKAGDYGLVMGHVKAAEILKKQPENLSTDADVSSVEKRINRLLVKASGIALDDVVVKYCEKMKVTDTETLGTVNNNFDRIKNFLMPKMREFLSLESARG